MPPRGSLGFSNETARNIFQSAARGDSKRNYSYGIGRIPEAVGTKFVFYYLRNHGENPNEIVDFLRNRALHGQGERIVYPTELREHLEAALKFYKIPVGVEDEHAGISIISVPKGSVHIAREIGGYLMIDSLKKRGQDIPKNVETEIAAELLFVLQERKEADDISKVLKEALGLQKKQGGDDMVTRQEAEAIASAFKERARRVYRGQEEVKKGREGLDAYEKQMAVDLGQALGAVPGVPPVADGETVRTYAARAIPAAVQELDAVAKALKDAAEFDPSQEPPKEK
ncbi:MAG TPA: hypothetical protein VI933_03215 [archaeon]|nr:hypothetical protein [archaeon]